MQLVDPRAKRKYGPLVQKLSRISRWQGQNIKPSTSPSKHKALGIYTGYILLILIFFQAGSAELSEEE